MAKLRLEGIILIAVAVLGFVLFASTPIATETASVYIDADNWATATIRYNPFGGGKIITEGEVGGIPFTETVTFKASDLSDYNAATWVLPMLGMLLAIGGGVLYILDHEKIPKYVALILVVALIVSYGT